MNIKQELEAKAGIANAIYLNDIEVDPLTIKAIMINEVVPADPAQDVLQMGIYITNAVKTPKTEYTIDKSSIEKSLPYLEAEISLFPNVKVIMLMGDVAKKAFNMITKKATKKNAVPAVSTYKLRNSEIFYQGIRVMPSYIMTGGNILIEKSKVTMATEDIAIMLEIIK